MNINTISLRLILGILALLLPIVCLGLCVLYGYDIPDSISATYYLAPTITPFMIILGASSIVLICYKGYDKQDNIICTLAGIFGLCICLFPCYTYGLNIHWPNVTFPKNVGTFQLPVNISGRLHNTSAIIFFALLAYNSFFLFTKSSGMMTRNKRIRNIIYRVCGLGMIASFILMVPVVLFNIWGGTWFIETIALLFFSISWLTKCDIFPFLFCDTPYRD